MSTKYKLIRDKQIFEYPEERIEVCDTRHEIICFGIKELINKAIELKTEDFRNLDIISDMVELIYYLAEISYISAEEINKFMEEKFETDGDFSKFLLKIQ